jgi:hypothetical protein
LKDLCTATPAIRHNCEALCAMHFSV